MGFRRCIGDFVSVRCAVFRFLELRLGGGLVERSLSHTSRGYRVFLLRLVA